MLVRELIENLQRLAKEHGEDLEARLVGDRDFLSPRRLWDVEYWDADDNSPESYIVIS